MTNAAHRFALKNKKLYTHKKIFIYPTVGKLTELQQQKKLKNCTV